MSASASGSALATPFQSNNNNSGPKRIIITGGSGLVGRPVISYLLSHGHKILNLDLQPLDNPAVHTMITDLTDQAQVLSALSTPQFSFDEYRLARAPPQTADAVLHFAAYPRTLLAPDHKTFTTNVSAAFNVIDAACRLGVRKIVLASTQSAYGAAYAPARGQIPWLEYPTPEDGYDANPQDAYGLSKLVAETVGRSYAARFAADVYALRIGLVLTPGMYKEWIPRILGDAEVGRRAGWSYTDARDLGQMCQKALEVDGLGWQLFNAVNDGIIAEEGVSSREWLGKVDSGVKLGDSLEGRQAPTSNAKIKSLLGFKEEFTWEEELRKDMGE